MAIHIPLLLEAQVEARILMLSSYNILSAASGRAVASPSQDMSIGAYFLTYKKDPKNLVIGSSIEVPLTTKKGVKSPSIESLANSGQNIQFWRNH